MYWRSLCHYLNLDLQFNYMLNVTSYMLLQDLDSTMIYVLCMLYLIFECLQ